METRWLYRSSDNFAELRSESCGVCVIPMGCSEKHGLHLPVGTDIIAASDIAFKASQLETCCVFPDFTFGNITAASTHYSPDGSLVIPVKLQFELLEVLCDEISRNGFKKILVYNGHGGNTPWLQTFMQELRKKKRDYVFVLAETQYSLPHELANIILEKGSGCFAELTPEDEKIILEYHEKNLFVGHACVNETAYMLGITPENVHLDRLGIESGAYSNKTAYLRERGMNVCNYGWDIDYPYCYAGDDHANCTENIGKLVVRYESERLARAIKVLKQDEKLHQWQEEYQRDW